MRLHFRVESDFIIFIDTRTFKNNLFESDCVGKRPIEHFKDLTKLVFEYDLIRVVLIDEDDFARIKRSGKSVTDHVSPFPC